MGKKHNVLLFISLIEVPNLSLKFYDDKLNRLCEASGKKKRNIIVLPW
jgi:hypothetical protein